MSKANIQFKAVDQRLTRVYRHKLLIKDAISLSQSDMCLMQKYKIGNFLPPLPTIYG